MVENRIQVHPGAVAARLDAVGEPLLNVTDEGMGVGRTPGSEPPRDQEPGISVQGRPGPHTADAGLASHFVGQIPVLGVAERPDLIAPDPLCRHSANHAVVVPLNRLAQVASWLLDRVPGDPRNSGGGPDGTAVNQAADDGTTVGAG